MGAGAGAGVKWVGPRSEEDPGFHSVLLPACQRARFENMLLIIDSDTDFAAQLVDELQSMSLEATTACDGEQALTALRRGTPQLILVALGAGEGLELCRALQTLPELKRTTILARLDAQDPNVFSAAAAAGMQDFVDRADAPHVVARRLVCALRTARSLRQLDEQCASLILSQRIVRMGHWEFVVGHEGLACSDEARRILGLDDEPGELVLDDLVSRIPIDQREGFHQWLQAVTAGKSTSPLEHSVHHVDGSFRVVRQDAEVLCGLNDRRTRVTGVVQDLTERKQAEERTQFLSDHDSLTGLANRQQFIERTDLALLEAHKSGGHPTVLCLDLNQFKAIAGLLPDRASDMLLVAIARRLREGLREYDMVAHVSSRVLEASIARIRGDEFTLLLPDLKRAADAVVVGRRVLDVLAEPFEIDQQEVYVTASIGVSSFPADSHSSEELLKRAETAAYCARQQGRNTILFYSPTMNAKAVERLTLETGLRRALERNELAVHYQPRIDIASGRMQGMEALVRWRHPELGLISPAQFIPLAEETGLIVPIGEWILETACRQCKEWQNQGLEPIRMAVNLSSVQFRQPDLFESVIQILRTTQLDPKWLEMELTESLLMQNPEQARKALQRLKAEGIHLSIDDFGTGYSSLAYLKRFPIDALKIDQTFIRELTTNADDAAIATSIILLGRSLKLRVVAEGVETPSQLSFLRVMQCDEAQGYLFSPPVAAEEARRFLDGSRQFHSAA